MPPISFKKILIAILAIVILSQFDHILAFARSVYQQIYIAFEPLRNCGPGAKYIVTLLFLALIYITVFKLLQNRK